MEGFLRRRRLLWFKHVKKLGEKRAPKKQKSVEINGSKKSRHNKRSKQVVEKDVIDKRLKKSRRSVSVLQRLGCESELTHARRVNKRAPERKYFSIFLKKSDDNDVQKFISK